MGDTAPSQSTSLKPHAALVAVQLIFGTWPIVGKIVLRALPSTGLVTFRVVGATLAFLLIRRATGHIAIQSKSDYARLALYSLLGVVLGYERGSWRVAVGLILAACGVIYLINPAQANFSRATNIGNLILLFNSMAYGTYIAISQDLSLIHI